MFGGAGRLAGQKLVGSASICPRLMVTSDGGGHQHAREGHEVADTPQGDVTGAGLRPAVEQLPLHLDVARVGATGEGRQGDQVHPRHVANVAPLDVRGRQAELDLTAIVARRNREMEHGIVAVAAVGDVCRGAGCSACGRANRYSGGVALVALIAARESEF